MTEYTKDNFPRSGINKYVTDYIRSLPDLTGKVAVDIPCGDGRASHEFRQKGATVYAFDLYPEFMKADGVRAQYADLMGRIPLEDQAADFVICQEGIEHMPDQVQTLREFNRVLKKGGTLILTTPSLSHLRARLSMFFVESDLWKRMPPTEVDGVWFSETATDRIYFGHLFLLGVNTLQTMCVISGFNITRRIKTTIGTTSVLLGIMLYPLFALVTLLSFALYRTKNKHLPQPLRDQILWDRVKLNLSPATLVCKHIFWVLRKESENDEVTARLKGLMRGDHD